MASQCESCRAAPWKVLDKWTPAGFPPSQAQLVQGLQSCPLSVAFTACARNQAALVGAGVTQRDLLSPRFAERVKVGTL